MANDPQNTNISAGGLGQAQYPPFSYGPLGDEGQMLAPNQFPLTKDNCMPALVVWLFLVHNKRYLQILDGSTPDDPQNPILIPVDVIAEATNLTVGAVQGILSEYIASAPAKKVNFQAACDAFQAFALANGYIDGGTNVGKALINLARNGVGGGGDKCLPLLVVWLFLTTNPDYLDVLDKISAIDPLNPPMLPPQQIANGTKLTLDAVHKILSIYPVEVSGLKVPALHASLREVTGSFQNLAVRGGYGGGNCPDNGEAMVTLAQNGAFVDPRAGV